MTRRWLHASPALLTGLTLRVLPVLLVFLVIGLQWLAITRQSLTMDEPYHLLAGYQALATGSNMVNWAHPPLVKLAAALPLLAEPEPVFRTAEVDGALAAASAIYERPALAHRVRLASRTVVALLFGLPFLAAAFWLGATYADRATGWALALFLGLAFPVLPHLPLVLTDASEGLGYLVFLVGGIRLIDRPGFAPATLMGLGCGLALAVKFSGVFLLPALPLAIALAPAVALRRRLALLAIAAVLATAVPYASYAAANRSWDAAAGRRVLDHYVANRATLVVGDELQGAEPVLARALALDPGLGQWLTGLLGVAAQNRLGIYPSYAFGHIDSDGRWWYFPVLFLVKTPLAILVALLAAVWAAASAGIRAGAGDRLRSIDRRSWLITAVAALYLLPSLTSSYNLGYRHLLPVLPLLWLPAARWAARREHGGAQRWQGRRLATILGVLALETILLAPSWMAATNTWWLGNANPTRTAFAGDNLEYKQSFLTLGSLAETRRLDPLYVVFPGASSAEVRANIPAATRFTPGDELAPGWYAVTLMAEQLLPAILLAEPDRVFAYPRYRRIAEVWLPPIRELEHRGEDHGIVAGSFHLYRLPGPGEPPSGRP